MIEEDQMTYCARTIDYKSVNLLNDSKQVCLTYTPKNPELVDETCIEMANDAQDSMADSSDSDGAKRQGKII